MGLCALMAEPGGRALGSRYTPLAVQPPPWLLPSLSRPRELPDQKLLGRSKHLEPAPVSPSELLPPSPRFIESSDWPWTHFETGPIGGGDGVEESIRDGELEFLVSFPPLRSLD